jgi:hypothetical protein
MCGYQKLDLDMIINYKSTGRVIELFPSDNETGRVARVEHLDKFDKKVMPQ